MPISGKELELFESVEFCLALLGALPLPIFMVDETGSCHTLSDLNSPAMKKLENLLPSHGGNVWKLDMTEADSPFVQAVQKARKDNRSTTVKGKWKYKKTLVNNELMLVIHATPAQISGKQYIIVAVEDTTELERLKGLLPICMQCSKIYNDKTSNWDRIDTYISSRTTADFSHGLCPECLKEMKQQMNFDTEKK